MDSPRKQTGRSVLAAWGATLVPTVPAICNAVRHACGVRIYDLPITREKIKAGLASEKP